MSKNSLTEKWEVYFNELEISFISEEEVTTTNGETYKPSFYLPDYQCFAEVNDGPFEKSNFDRARQLVKDTKIPLVLLNKDPQLSSYQIIVANENGPNGVEIEDINLCNHPHRPEKDEFIKNVFLENQKMFQEAGLSKVISAVEKAKANTEDSSSLERQWMTYFDQLNIDYKPQKRVTLKSGTQHTFSFFLPELECLVEVVGPPITNSHHNNIVKTVVESKTPVLFIQGYSTKHGYSYFVFLEIIMPKGGKDYDVKAFKIIKEGNKLVGLEGPTGREGQSKRMGFPEAISAVKKVNK